MNTRTIRCTMFAASLAVLIPFWTLAADPVASGRIVLGPGSSLWLEGKSNIHDFESRTSDVSLSIEKAKGAADPTSLAEFEALVRGSGITALDVRIPIASLRSGKSGLDKNLMKAMDAHEHPDIRFHLSHYTVQHSPRTDTLLVHAEGQLSMSGHERPVTLEARMVRVAKGLWLDGTQVLRMTDFEIKPPRMLMGTMRVADRIDVHYHLLLEPTGAQTGAAVSNSN